MEINDTLTNEKILKKFKSQFELVNYAIRLAENMIHTGRDPRVKTDAQNRALQIVEEIEQDKDRFDEIIIEEPLQDLNSSYARVEVDVAAQKFYEPKKKLREKEHRL
jgi:hypothetical protein